MHQSATSAHVAPTARNLALASLAVTVLLSSGYFFHTCHSRMILWKYDVAYSVGLVLWFALVIPVSYFVPKFLLSPSRIRLRRRDAVVRPGHKLAAAIILILAGYIAISEAISCTAKTTIATRNPNQFHPYLQNVAKPGHEGQHINRWGFRGDDIELEKPAGTYRIFVFGGSTVYCGTVPYEQTHCRILERTLQDRYPERPIEVQNLGAEWHCSQHSLIKLLCGAEEFSPDLVIIYHGINDLVRSWSPDAFGDGEFRPDYGHYLGAASNLAHPSRAAGTFSRSHFGHWLSDFRFQQVRLDGPDGHGLNGVYTLFFPRAKPVEYDDWKSLPVFERNMREFVQHAQRRGLQVLLATQPSLYRDDLSEHERKVLVFPISQQFDGRQASLSSMIGGMRQFNDTTRRIADEENVPLADLDSIVPKHLEYMYDDVHYTPRGNELIGRTLATAIIELELLDESASK